MSQDRNTPKFIGRIFKKYHERFTNHINDSLRIIDVNNAY